MSLPLALWLYHHHQRARADDELLALRRTLAGVAPTATEKGNELFTSFARELEAVSNGDPRRVEKKEKKLGVHLIWPPPKAP